MESKHDGDIRGFSILSEAYYAKACMPADTIDEVMIGMYSQDRGTSGEFAVRWFELGNKITPRLEVFDDAWSALAQFGDVLRYMASVDGLDVSPQAFCAALRDMGIIDRTTRVDPHKRIDPAESEYASWFAA